MEEILSFGLSLKTAFQIIPRERFPNASKICITQSLSIQGFPGIFSSIALMIVGQCRKVVSVWWQNVRMLAIPARTSSTCDRHAMMWFWSLTRIEIFHIVQILLVFVENWYSLAKWLWKAGFSLICERDWLDFNDFFLSVSELRK